MLFSLKCLLLKAHFLPGAPELLEGSCVPQAAVFLGTGVQVSSGPTGQALGD